MYRSTTLASAFVLGALLFTGCDDGPCPSGQTLCGDTCVDTDSDALHCGACDSPCAGAANQSATCEVGVCTVECTAGFGDCDPMAAGCETNLNTDVNHCGVCANACPEALNEVAACGMGMCGVRCEAGFGDCDASTDGCETDLLADVNHCGACDDACATPQNAGIACAEMLCVVGACDDTYADLDDITGCEQSVSAPTAVLRSLAGDRESAAHQAIGDDQGNYYLGWRDYDGSGLVLRASVYSATNGTWSTPVGIQDHDAGDGPVIRAIPGGGAWYMWRERNLMNTSQSYYYATRVYPDGTADAPTPLVGPAVVGSGRLIVGDDGSVTAGWLSQGTIRYRRLAAGSSTWTAAAAVAGSNGDDGAFVLIRAGAGSVIATFNRLVGGDRGLNEAVYDTSDGDFGAAQLVRPIVAGVQPSVRGHAVLGDGTELMVFRQTDTSTFTTTHHIMHRASGGTWSTPVELDPTQDIAGFTYRELSNGTVRMIWQRRENDGNARRVMTALYDPTTGSLGASVAHGELGSNTGGWAVVALAGSSADDLLVVWSTGSAPGSVLRATRFSNTGGTWSSSWLASDDSNTAPPFAPRLLLAPNGDLEMFYVTDRVGSGDPGVYQVPVTY